MNQAATDRHEDEADDRQQRSLRRPGVRQLRTQDLGEGLVLEVRGTGCRLGDGRWFLDEQPPAVAGAAGPSGAATAGGAPSGPSPSGGAAAGEAATASKTPDQEKPTSKTPITAAMCMPQNGKVSGFRYVRNGLSRSVRGTLTA